MLLLDHLDKVGAKILISGGGRCNFTNLHCAPDRFLSANPHFRKSALDRYTQHDFIALVERHRIAYHEKTLGQLFCDGSARAIVAMLLAECAAGEVDVRLGHSVTDISRGDDFRVETDKGSFTAASLVLATGGLSIPKMGATGFTYDVARRFGLRITETLPGLVPLTATPEALGLAEVLVGHLARRRSRPAGRRASAKTSCSPIAACPARRSCRSRPTGDRARRSRSTCCRSTMRRRFLKERKRTRPEGRAEDRAGRNLSRPPRAGAWRHPCRTDRWPTSPTARSTAFAARLKRWEVTPTGTEGYAKAEVTVGGIDTRDLSSKTMEARNVPGLYVIGEAVDVTGWLGGYNFQWAWSSGWCAGQASIPILGASKRASQDARDPSCGDPARLRWP